MRRSATLIGPVGELVTAEPLEAGPFAVRDPEGRQERSACDPALAADLDP